VLRRSIRRTAVVLSAGAVLLATLWLLWWAPGWLVAHAATGPLKPDERVNAITEERRTLLGIFAAVGAGLTLWYTHQRHSLDRDSNRTEPVHQGR
jgi:hypothetical protein